MGCHCKCNAECKGGVACSTRSTTPSRLGRASSTSETSLTSCAASSQPAVRIAELVHGAFYAQGDSQAYDWTLTDCKSLFATPMVLHMTLRVCGDAVPRQYQDRIISSDTGHLRLYLTRDLGGSLISSTNTLLYGNVTARVRTSQNQGIVTAFYLMVRPRLFAFVCARSEVRYRVARKTRLTLSGRRRTSATCRPTTTGSATSMAVRVRSSLATLCVRAES